MGRLKTKKNIFSFTKFIIITSILLTICILNINYEKIGQINDHSKNKITNLLYLNTPKQEKISDFRFNLSLINNNTNNNYDYNIKTIKTNTLNFLSDVAPITEKTTNLIDQIIFYIPYIILDGIAILFILINARIRIKRSKKTKKYKEKEPLKEYFDIEYRYKKEEKQPIREPISLDEYNKKIREKIDKL